MSTSPPSRPAGTGYIGLLRREPRYRCLWTANVISLLGDWLDLIAVTELLVNLSGQPGARYSSAAAMAGLMVARFLPSVVWGPLAGHVADRYRRDIVMIWTNRFSAAMVLLILPFLTPQGVPIVIALTFLKMTGQAFFMPAIQAAVPMLVQREDLQDANALGAASWSVMLAVGAVAGAIAVHWLGPQMVLVLNALTFSIANLFLLKLKLPLPEGAAGAERRSAVVMRQGLDYLRQNTHLAGPLLVKTVLGISGGAILYPLLAEQAWPRPNPDGTLDISFVTGVLYFAFGIGTLIGPLVSRQFGQPGVGAMLVRLGPALLLTGGFGVLFPLAPGLTWAFVWVVVSSMFRSVLWVYSTTLLQLLVPDSFRGRVFAVEFALMTFGTTIAIVLSQQAVDRGLVDARGLGVALGIFAALGAIPYGLYWQARRRPEALVE